jgi:uncharacterized protein (TIGR02996 family)
MTQDEAFLQAIIENPEDDAPRLVYADWLDEQGCSERAELIRIQCELAHMAVFNDQRRQLQKRQQQVLDAHGRTWLMQEWPQAANRVIKPTTFERGFAADLSLCGRELGENSLRALAKSPRLVLLTALDLRKNGMTENAVLALATSSLLTRLTFLDLRENPLSTESLKAVTESPHLAQLRELLVGPKGIRLEDVQGWFRREMKDVAVHTGETIWRSEQEDTL